MFRIILLILLFLLLVSLSHTDNTTNIIQTLVRQTARWQIAAEQDMNPIVAMLHANYAAGYLWALKDVFTDNEIEQATGINILTFRDAITNTQDKITRKLSKLCPNFSLPDTYVGRIAAYNY